MSLSGRVVGDWDTEAKKLASKRWWPVNRPDRIIGMVCREDCFVRFGKLSKLRNRRNGSLFSGPGVSHELLDNKKNPEDQNKVRCSEAYIHEYWNPLRGPRNKQNPQNMKSCDQCHCDPEPRLPP